MSHYPAFICENGHPISTCSGSQPDKFCQKCGARIISSCTNCGKTIRGIMRDDSYALFTKYAVPSYCPSCGKPYPWISNAIEATVCMLKESELSTADQDKLISSLPDILTETPQTQLASARYKKAIAIGGFIAEGLRDFVTNFACDAFKRCIGLL